jgi:coatomer subunit beta
MSDTDCTLLIACDIVPPKASEIQAKLEKTKVQDKIDAMEELILLMASGEQYRNMLMPVIRFVCTHNNHRLKKLCQLFWEVIQKTDEKSGDLREEMILVCNALRNDLMHANEYVRGSTLRLLCKIRHYRILEPLIEPVVRNLTHRHSYVRRNAVMCLYSIVKAFGPDAVPNAGQEIEQLLRVETDSSTKRNAFLMLLHTQQDKALEFVTSLQDEFDSMNDIFQLVFVELIRRVCRSNPGQKMRLLRLVLGLAQSSPSAAVKYECAASLIALTSSPSAVESASATYVRLLIEQADTNVKLIVLDRLLDIRRRYSPVIQGQLMDILRGLSCPANNVRKKVLEIALGNLVTEKSVKDVVGFLKKEVLHSMEGSAREESAEYRRMLIRHLHSCVARFPEEAATVIHILVDLLSDSDAATATDVIMFLRELIAQPGVPQDIVLGKLQDTCTEISHSRVIRGCLWLLGEYCTEPDMVASVVEGIVTAMEPLPLKAVERVEKVEKTEEAKAGPPKVTTRTVILADGTYGTEEVRENVEEVVSAEQQKTCPWRELILGGDFLLGTVTAYSLTKLMVKDVGGQPGKAHVSPRVLNKALLFLASFVKYIRNHPMGGDVSDSLPRVVACIKALTGDVGAWGAGDDVAKIRLQEVMSQEAAQLSVNSGDLEEADDSGLSVPPETCVMLRQLLGRQKGMDGPGDDEGDVNVAKGGGLGSDDGALFADRLAKSKQLSGTQDPIYVEGFLQVQALDLLLELLLINRTGDTLENVAVELSTHGELKLVDRPPSLVLAPYSQATVVASIKVSSTETGVIFGYVTYDRAGTPDRGSIALSELHIDVVDYVERGWVAQLSFRTMWSEFEWENKINIVTQTSDVAEFLSNLMHSTNMSIVGRPLVKSEERGASMSMQRRERITKDEAREQIKQTPGIKALVEGASFVAVNLYSRSIFGEDALANVSIERVDGKLTGSIRIRSRTQGIALGLGNSIARTAL